MTPQIIVLVLILIGLLINANKHGQPKDGQWNFWPHLLGVIINILILYWGGFFNVFFK